MTDHCRGVCNVYRFDAAHPGTVFVKLYADSSEESFCLFRRGVSADFLKEMPPAAIKPPGLDPARQWYLYNNIRQFVPDDSKDVLCPRPLEVELQAQTLSIYGTADYTASVCFGPSVRVPIHVL